MKKVIALVAVILCCSMSTLMAQPPGGGGGQQRSPEERIAAMKEQLKPLGLTPVQADSVVAIMMDRSGMPANMRDMSPEERQAAMKTMTEARNKRLEKALGADLAKKVAESMPQGRGGGGRPGGGQQ